jgi:HK97 family phage major capsid protein
MADYTDVIGRQTYPTTDPLVPQPLALEIIQEMPTASALLARARRVTMSTKSTRQPVLSVLPQAYWVGGDTGLKQTTKQMWDNITLVAEELATIVVVPDAYISDAGVPIWDEVKPRIVEAFGRKIDQAGIFGIGRPSTWATSVYEQAVAAGNVVTHASADLAVDVANLGKVLVRKGFALDGFMTAPGFQWELVGLRNSQGTPIYTPSLSAGTPDGLYGMPLSESLNGGWDATKAALIGGDFDNAILGMRQDITMTTFTEGVVTDDAGAVVVNLMQQDAKALRVVMRLGFAVANPVTPLAPNASTRSPFAVLGPVADLS